MWRGAPVALAPLVRTLGRLALLLVALTKPAGPAQVRESSCVAIWKSLSMRTCVLGGWALVLATSVVSPPGAVAADDGTWDDISAPSPPPARRFHSAIYDPVRERMLV